MDRVLYSTSGNPSRSYYQANQVVLPVDAIVEIVSVEKVNDYVLNLRFSDGHESLVDFAPFLKESRNPHIRSYLDIEKFGDLRIENGDLVWGDYEMCFPVADLYEGKI